MSLRLWAGGMLAAFVLILSSVPASAQEYYAKLSGVQELGSLNAETGAILSQGEGTLKLTLDKTAQTLNYTLTYTFPSTASVLQSHIHFGKEHVPGGVMVYFCTNLTPPATPAVVPPPCPTYTGTVSGTITASDVQAISGQNVPAGDFAALVNALTTDTAYANIHTENFKAGEIRGQIHRLRNRDDHDRRRWDGNRGDDNGRR